MKKIDNYLFFYGGKDGIYSNWYKSEFSDPLKGFKFSTSEQAFMWYKADFFWDLEAKSSLQNLNLHPKEAKEIGRGIKRYNETLWKTVRFGYMVYVNYLKFSQDENLKKQLLETKGLTLVEASPYDNVWGIGLGLDTPDYILELPDNWKGQNLLGKALMEVRDLLS